MRKAVLMMICVLICLVCFSCKPSPDYYAALQYEWLVTEKPAGWTDERYIFDNSRVLSIYYTDGTSDSWSVDNVYVSRIHLSKTKNRDKREIIIDYSLLENNTVLSITYADDSAYSITFVRQ